MVRHGRSAADTSSMRANNVGIVLHHIWTGEHVSRASIVRATGLSRATVSDIVGGLIDDGLVTETGAGDSRGGRKPILLELVDDARFVVGIEFVTQRIDVVLMGLRGQVVATSGTPYDVGGDAAGAHSTAADLVAKCISDAGVDRSLVLGAGAGVYAPLHGEGLRYVSEFTLPDWEGIDVVAALTEQLHMPVVIDNDANVGAIAEKLWGSGRGHSDFTYLRLDVGVGAGHVIRGEVYRGHGGSAGEIGHIAVALDGPRCRCGLSGCLEAFIGSDALVSRYRTLRRPERTSISQVEDVIAAALEGDPVAVEVVSEAGRYLGLAISHVLCLLNPGMVILSGPLSAAGDVLITPLRETIDRYSFAKSITEAEIVVSDSQHLTVAMGAAARVLETELLNGGSVWVPETGAFVPNRQQRSSTG